MLLLFNQTESVYGLLGLFALIASRSDGLDYAALKSDLFKVIGIDGFGV